MAESAFRDQGPLTEQEVGEVTRLLKEWGGGRAGALEELFPLVYRELRALAGASMNRERKGHTLQPTALVHEAFMRLVGQDRVEWRGRLHFIAVAAQAMRRVLVDHARRRLAQKRISPEDQVPIDLLPALGVEPTVDLIDLDDALARLTEIDERQARIVELRFFGGMTVEETAEALDISRATVKRDWTMARAWLKREIDPA